MCASRDKPHCLFSGVLAGFRVSWRARGSFSLALVLVASGVSPAAEPNPVPAALPGLSYTNARVADVPWSIHVVQWERSNSLYQLQSLHAQGKALGLDTLSDQLAALSPALGTPVAAINGDFYQRDKAYAGAPRGLQIVAGELLSAPSGGASFWIDALGEPHTGKVASAFQITWPDGTTSTFGLNGERRTNGLELYTAAIGASTHTVRGRELVLVRAAGSRWLPLRIGQTYLAQVREIREAGDTRLADDTLVLSMGPAAMSKLPEVQAGAVLRISTASQPALHGIRAAISGGPMLLQNGKRERLNVADSESYEVTSMEEQHPRTAIGWNERYLFLVVVDGRQKHLSIGMTLEELAKLLTKLGCREAMNFDGGGSATLWYNGEVRNSPCDRMEREIANCLAIVKKKR
jgi:hypothetical protein